MNHKNATQHRLALSAILFLLAAGATAVQAAIPASERAVLLDLYASTNGGSWTESSGWGGAVGTECTWYGVTCDAGGNTVKFIVLQQDNLSGSLPALTGLTNLQYFLVDSPTSYPDRAHPAILPVDATLNRPDQLAGLQCRFEPAHGLDSRAQRPDQLAGLQTPLATSSPARFPRSAGLTNLGNFDVGGNQLTGAIPALTGLTNLRDFQAYSNQLSGTIPALAGLTSLRSFEVQENQLTGAIPVLDGLTSLQYFYAGSEPADRADPRAHGTDKLARLHCQS